MFFLDPLFLMFMVPTLILGLIAQATVKSRFAKFSKVRTLRGLTGAQAARALLDQFGLHDVRIEESHGGQLSDHYDPRGRVLRLSSEVGRSPSVAAVGVAAHEAGHAIQHAQGYVPLQLRSAIVPAVSIGSQLGPWIILGGILLQGALNLGQLGALVAWVGVIMFAGVVVFSFITLPVELDASARAKKLLYQFNIVDRQELNGVTSVLNAAAWTYVIAALAALSQLVYYIFILTGGRRR